MTGVTPGPARVGSGVMSTSAERMRRLRERRAAGLAPAADRVTGDPDDLLVPAVEVTVAALALGGADAGAAQLARIYASALDSAADQALAIRRFGPLLLDALRELGATPAAQCAKATRGSRGLG